MLGDNEDRGEVDDDAQASSENQQYANDGGLAMAVGTDNRRGSSRLTGVTCLY